VLTSFFCHVSSIIAHVIFVYGFIISSGYIKFNIVEVVKQVEVVDIKFNKLVDYIIDTI